MPSIHRSLKDWKGLFIISGICAILASLLFRRNLSSELFLAKTLGIINVGPEKSPVTAAEWFSFLQDDWILGIIYLDFFDIVNYILVSLVFLGLYGYLKQKNKGRATLALSFGLLGIFLYFTTNQTFSMINLSNLYASATTESERNALLAAGEAILRIYNPNRIYQGATYYLSHFFVNSAGLLFSLMILKDSPISKKIAYSGIIAHVLLLSYFIPLIIIPDLTFISISFAAPFLLVYYFLIGRHFLFLERNIEDQKPANHSIAAI